MCIKVEKYRSTVLTTDTEPTIRNIKKALVFFILSLHISIFSIFANLISI